MLIARTIVLVLGLSACVVGCEDKSAPIATGTDKQRVAEMQQVLGAKQNGVAAGESSDGVVVPKVSDEVFQAVEARFASFGEAIMKQKPRLADEYFNFDPMIGMLEEVLGEKSTRTQREQLRRQFAGDFNLKLMSGEMVDLGRPFKVMAVIPTGEGSVAVYTTHYDKELTAIQMKWWMTHARGVWQIYDFEDVLMGLQWSMLTKTLIQSPKDDDTGGDPLQKFLKIVSIIKQVGAIDLDEVEQHRKSIEEWREELRVEKYGSHSQEIMALKWTGIAMCNLWLGEYERVFSALDQAESYRKDVLVYNFFRGCAYAGDGRYQLAIEYMNKYTAVAGYNADVYSLYGTCYAELGQMEKAYDIYRKALDELPEDGETLAEFAVYLDEAKKEEVADRIKRMPNPEASFELIGETITANGDVAALAVASKTFREINAEDYNALFYSGVYAEWNEEYITAADYYKRSLIRAGQVAPDETDLLRKRYWSAMALSGKGMEAYLAAADFPAAYKIIGDDLFDVDEYEQLDALATLHLKTYPNSLSAGYHKAWLLSDAKEWDDALALLEHHLTLEMSKGDLDLFLEEYAYVMCQVEKWEEACKRFAGNEIVFDGAARHLIDTLEYKALYSLLHRYGHAQSDQNKWFWWAEYFYGMKQWPELLSHIHEFGKKIDFDIWPARSTRMQVAAHLAMGDHKQAMVVGKAYDKEGDGHFFEFAVSIAKDDVERVIELFEEMKDYWTADDLKDDWLTKDLFEREVFKPFINQFFEDEMKKKSIAVPGS
ncbi:hypothetical protein [Poriferisphaera sp. WC338]|uniref:hypothetical protein n=1 Tax=Poriferisphaera sp. WC338 TaxID=3425129 RepID=UPI003D81BE9E